MKQFCSFCLAVGALLQLVVGITVNEGNQNQQKTKSKTMKNKLIMMAAAIIALASFSSDVRATPITGSIGFTGGYVQNGGTQGNLTTATSMSIINSTIGFTSGNFIGATLLNFTTPINVNPTVGLGQLWQVLVGTTTYTFAATSASQNLTTHTGLHILGTGTISNGNAADTTAGTFQLGFGVSGDAFQWQSTSTAAGGVPDGGSTVMLLGASLAGLSFIKRKVTA
jgi:hypothetical protein